MGYNVVAPLLPGHGLLFPTRDFQEKYLYQRWCMHVLAVVSLTRAQLGPVKLFIGGYSIGCILALHTVLRLSPNMFAGLFLFAPPSGLFHKDHLSRMPGAHWIARYFDRNYTPGSNNPFEFERLPVAAGLQVARLIDQTKAHLRKIQIPVLMVQTLAETTTNSKGMTSWMKKYCLDGRYVGLYSPGLPPRNPTVTGRNMFNTAMFDEIQETVVRFIERVLRDKQQSIQSDRSHSSQSW
jgi:pimeloyl-ACP methyl ester carboxylesterase